MYSDNNYLFIYIDNIRIFEHKLNSLVNYSLHDVFTKHTHHINHCPLDNSPSNLLVLSNSEHRRLHNAEFSDEDKRKISEGLKGHPVSQETISKLREINKCNTYALKDHPTIIRNGISPKGEQIYSIHFQGKIYASSINKEILIKALEDNTWKDKNFSTRKLNPRKPNEHPSIQKITTKGKVQYRAYYHGKTLKTSINRTKIEKYLESDEWKSKYASMCKD